MDKEQVLRGIRKTGVVAVIRAQSPQKAELLAEAVRDGGICALEITMTVPGAVEIIRKLAAKYADTDVLVGAGTVLDPETARVCILAGASFIVSPMLNVEVIKLCNRYGVAVIPGVMTVTEAVKALEYGATLLKLFPADAYGPSILNAFRGPLPQADFIPTGGVNLTNCGEWIKAGAAAIGSGGDLTRLDGGDYGVVTQKAAQFIDAVAKARESSGKV